MVIHQAIAEHPPAESLARQLKVLEKTVAIDVVAKLNSGLVAAVASPEISERIAGFGVRLFTGTPGEFDALMRAEHEKYARLVKLSGARLD